MTSPEKNDFDWSEYGKAMMVLSGLNCLALAIFMPQESFAIILRVWVASFGILNVWYALLRGR